MLEAVPGWRRWQRAPFSQLWRRLCALRTAPQLHPRTHNPTNSTTPKFQISTRAAIGKYDNWKFDFSKPSWISWWSVFMVPFEKSWYFFWWKMSWLSATVVCGLLQYGAWLSRVAAAAAAWESPWSELQIFRSLLFVFLATLKLTLIIRFFSPCWPAGVPPILSVWFWSVGRVVGDLVESCCCCCCLDRS